MGGARGGCKIVACAGMAEIGLDSTRLHVLRIPVIQERDVSRWIDFEVGDRDEAALMRLLERLPDAERYESDDYKVRKWLPHNKHVVGKGGAVNWNEGLHSMLRGKLNRLVRRTKGCAKNIEMLVNLLALVFCDKLKLNTTQS